MSDVLTIYLSGDAWNGNAAASLTVNGVAVGGTLDVAAVNATDSVQAFTFKGNFGPTPVVAVSFINDASNGNPLQNRNFYLDGFSYNGVPQLGYKKALIPIALTCNSPGHLVGGGIDRSRLSTSQRVNGTAR